MMERGVRDTWGEGAVEVEEVDDEQHDAAAVAQRALDLRARLPRRHRGHVAVVVVAQPVAALAEHLFLLRILALRLVRGRRAGTRARHVAPVLRGMALQHHAAAGARAALAEGHGQVGQGLLQARDQRGVGALLQRAVGAAAPQPRRRSVQGCRWLPWGAVGAEAGGAAGQSGDGAAPQRHSGH